MNIKFIKLLIISSFALFFFSVEIKAQIKKESNFLKIESILVDSKGVPVKGASIFSGVGTASAKTNADGKFSLSLPDDAFLTIEADGFEPLVIKNLKQITEKVTLTKSRYLYGENDYVNIPFRKEKKGDINGAVNFVNPWEIRKYDNTHDIPDALAAMFPGLLGTNNIRGFGGALILVDGLPRRIDNINLEEIDQITVLKDVNSIALYGGQAKNGVILITTKRGEPYKNNVTVTADYGLKMAKALPQFLGSADYMVLYNEALKNDGLKEKYDASTIDNFRNGNPFRYPDIDYFSSNYLKKAASTADIITTFSGGTENAVYFTSIGWNDSKSLADFGEAANDRDNRFNIRGNIDFKVNDFISSYMNTSAIFGVSRSERVNYWQLADSLRPNLYTPLIPIDLVDPNNDDLIKMVNARKNDVDGKYLIGGTIDMLTQPFGTIYKGGFNNFVQRTFQFNTGVDVDLNRWIKGLSFHTYLGFDLYTYFNQYFSNNYSVYQANWNPVQDTITGLTKYGDDSNPGVQTIGTTDFKRSVGFYGKFDYKRTFGDAHRIDGSLLGYGNTINYPNVIQPDKYAHLGLTLAYYYNDKYIINFGGVYSNSVKLPNGNKAGFAPTIGLAWVISSENFMSRVKYVDFLKIKASAGIINSDVGIGGYYYYDNMYSQMNSYSWADGAWSGQGFRSNFGANGNLFFEKRKEINLGIEGTFFNRFLILDMNAFTDVFSDIVAKPTTIFPGYYTDFVSNKNFNKNRYRGGEVGISINKSLGNFSLTLNGNLMYVKTKVLAINEIYADKYQYRQGKPVNVIFGLQSDGFFTSQADINASPFQAFGEVKPGDIKYIDQNNDGIIDQKDRIYIGQSQPPFSYGLSLVLRYKNLSLFMIGNGRIGEVGMKSNNYFWVDGDDKYSKVVLDRWTEETKNTATFPRLSSITSTNNFQNSTFWLYTTDYFSLDRMQLTYLLPDKITKRLSLNNLSLFVNGSGLLRISKNKDILDLNVGTEPQYRYFSGGASIKF